LWPVAEVTTWSAVIATEGWTWRTVAEVTAWSAVTAKRWTWRSVAEVTTWSAVIAKGWTWRSVAEVTAWSAVVTKRWTCRAVAEVTTWSTIIAIRWTRWAISVAWAWRSITEVLTWRTVTEVAAWATVIEFRCWQAQRTWRTYGAILGCIYITVDWRAKLVGKPEVMVECGIIRIVIRGVHHFSWRFVNWDWLIEEWPHLFLFFTCTLWEIVCAGCMDFHAKNTFDALPKLAF
jgi:hypothetical protein